MKTLRVLVLDLFVLLPCHVLIILIIFCFIFVNASIVFAASTSSPQEIRIAYLPKQDFLDENYNPPAFFNDYFRILAKYFNNEVSFVPGTVNPSDLFNLIKNNDANVVGFLTKNPERLFQFKFTKNPAFTATLYITTNNNKDFFYGDTKRMNDKSIALYSANTIGKNTLEEFLAEKNISMKFLIYNNFNDYALSEADFHLSNSLYYIKDKQIVQRIGELEYYFATTEKHHALLNILDHAIDMSQRNDIIALRQLYEKYIDKSYKTVDAKFDENETKVIQKPVKIYQLGYLSNHYPIQYIDENNAPAGITPMVHELLTIIHDNPDELVPFSVFADVDIEKFDMLFSVIGHNEIKEKYYNESKPYAKLPMVIFKPIDLPDDKVKSFGMLNYSVIKHEDIQNYFSHWQMRIYSTLDELLNAYKNKLVDSILLSKSEAEYAFTELGISNNEAMPTDLVLPLKFYLLKKYTDVGINVTNSFIDKLNPISVLRAIMTAEKNMHPPSTLEGIWAKYQNYLLSIVIPVLFLFIGLYVYGIYIERRKFHQLSLTDTLTGIATKEQAFAIMKRKLKNATENEYTIFCTDIDKFSMLNQVYGKAKANEVLCYLANFFNEKYGKKLKANCVARLRDDVFLVFIKTKYMKNAPNQLEDQLLIVNDIKSILDSNYNISMSRGYYIIDDVSLPIETIIDFCNAARYMGKNEYAISENYFDSVMKKQLAAEKEILHKMENAIEHDEFVLEFQPKVSLYDEQICGAEILVRWYPADGTTIFPDDFISVFEDNAFITKLDMHVFENTCQFISKNRKKIKIPPLAVNISGVTLMHDDTIMNVQNIIQHYNILPREIELEITESAMISDSNSFNNTVSKLCDLGFVVAIDDFGTGVSSLHRLNSLCVHIVKLDKAFLDDKFSTKNGIFLVASVINMLRRLGIQVVAEGVETEKHVHILKKLRCDIAQGYYFYKPLPEQTFFEVLQRSMVQGQVKEEVKIS